MRSPFRPRFAFTLAALAAAVAAPLVAQAPATGYAGHGADSVSRETIQKYAPAPLPADVSGRIQQALDLHAGSPDRFEEARTRLVYGEHLRRRRRRVEARAQLRAALELFEHLGATPWSDRASAELAATGERVHRRSEGPIAALTERELQIGLLLADGMTTRQAAAALFVSPKTVEYHLRHVYTKLGIGSRAELAAALPAYGTA